MYCTVSVLVCFVILKLFSTLKIKKLHESIPRSAVDKFVQLCRLCHARKPQPTRAPLRPITLSGYMTRGQVIGRFVRNFHIGFDHDYECH